MDTVLELYDEYLMTPYVYPKGWSEGSWSRQLLTLSLVLTLYGYALYFVLSGLSYWLSFDKRLLQHPLFLENQVGKEIRAACESIPLMSILSAVFFLLEIRGFSKLHHSSDGGAWGWISTLFEIMTFIVLTDLAFYWTHRALHSSLLYKRFHKVHHKWKVTTPFAALAIHPLDGFVQGLPYHIYVFIFPMNKNVFLSLFMLMNIWAVSIHDGNFKVPRALRPFISGTAHHSDHHMYYHYNYGQYFTFWDRIFGSFREPTAYTGQSPSHKGAGNDLLLDKKQ